ncbi:putative ubiquinol--cytochrome-c reductase [Hypoxylon sp. NC1633]|nr:putative ubiquinol--cytochrome-c reductase [Hypoxylon sp. NC1633]
MAGSYPSLAPYVLKRPWLLKLLRPVSNWYTNAAGYRKLGLWADDLINEENETVLKALKRLPPKVAYDRVYRLRRAFQCSTTHRLLPKEEWTKEEFRYLQPLIDQIIAEEKEKNALDSLTVVRSH